MTSKPVPSKKSILESKVKWEEQRLEQEQFRKMMAEKLKRDFEERKPEQPQQPKPTKKPTRKRGRK